MFCINRSCSLLFLYYVFKESWCYGCVILEDMIVFICMYIKEEFLVNNIVLS